MLSSQFLASIEELIALDPRVKGLAEALTTTSPEVSLRFNAGKDATVTSTAADDSRCESLSHHSIDVCAGVPWCPAGYYLASRPRFTLDPALHQGLYYVQDASSMFISHVIKSITGDIDHPLTYLDACAAPGGKTTAAIDALPQGSLVVANEWDYKRAEILVENVMKWGYPATAVSRGDTARYSKFKNAFDIVAADVPCSGEGMMRKDTVAVEQWSPALVAQCVERQREIVDNLWPALKEGGFFIYSTCTFNRHENEEMVQYLIDEYDAEPVTIDIDGFEGILGSIGSNLPCYRFMPHMIKGEGLFMAVVRKLSRCESFSHQSNAQLSRCETFSHHGSDQVSRCESFSHQSKAQLSRCESFSHQRGRISLPDWFPTNLIPMVKDDVLWGIEPQWKSFIDKLAKTVDLIMPGVKIATIKGKDFIPSQALALSLALERDLFPAVEVDKENAINYLCRDAITLPDSTPRGYVLLTYQNSPLGFVKNLGNRSNNLYPAPWRILHR